MNHTYVRMATIEMRRTENLSRFGIMVDADPAARSFQRLSRRVDHCTEWLLRYLARAARDRALVAAMPNDAPGLLVRLVNMACATCGMECHPAGPCGPIEQAEAWAARLAALEAK